MGGNFKKVWVDKPMTLRYARQYEQTGSPESSMEEDSGSSEESERKKKDRREKNNSNTFNLGQ